MGCGWYGNVEDGVVMNSKERFRILRFDWKNCKKCSIGHEAYQHVFGRGDIPCDIVFIGEAPGKTEDYVGRPFVGLAGQLLDCAIEKSMKKSKKIWRVFFTNLLCCRPFNLEGGNRAPEDGEVLNCMPRLEETIHILKPKILVTLGLVPKNYLREENWVSQYRVFNLVHPAWVLRQGGIKSDAFKKFVKELREVFRG